jgi:hypothetical protein
LWSWTTAGCIGQWYRADATASADAGASRPWPERERKAQQIATNRDEKILISDPDSPLND